MSNLIPYQFYPKYNLFKLYYKSGDSPKTKQMARIILSMPVKKMSSDISAIKDETLEMLNKMTKNN